MSVQARAACSGCGAPATVLHPNPACDACAPSLNTPPPEPGTVAWVCSIAGPGAEVRTDRAAGVVTVAMPAGTSEARAREVRAKLNEEGALSITYEATIAGAADVSRAEGETDAQLRMRLRREFRSREEAPLAALVAAVPEGLDATGWRAMILMLWECWKDPTGRTNKNRAEDFVAWAHERKSDWPTGILGEAIRFVRAGTPIGRPRWLTEEAALYYRESIAPQGPRPAPERKGSTWRSRGPQLLLDADHDLAGLAAGVR